MNRPYQMPRGLSSLQIRLNTTQSSAFDFFHTQTIQQLPGGSSDLSWERLVLHEAMQQSAVTHAVVALASLHRAITNDLTACSQPGGARDRYQLELALANYSQALSGLRRFIDSINAERSCKSDTQVVLITMILLFCFEVIHGQDDQATLHLQTASQILHAQLGISSCEIDLGTPSILMRAKPENDIEVLGHTLIRLHSDSCLGSNEGCAMLQVPWDFRKYYADEVMQAFPPNM